MNSCEVILGHSALNYTAVVRFSQSRPKISLFIYRVFGDQKHVRAEIFYSSTLHVMHDCNFLSSSFSIYCTTLHHLYLHHLYRAVISGALLKDLFMWLHAALFSAAVNGSFQS